MHSSREDVICGGENELSQPEQRLKYLGLGLR